jgi:hypothetical protein
MIDTNLISAAVNHLRRKHSAQREAQLVAAGLPVNDRVALEKWIRESEDANHVERGGLYHACTARISSGVDAELPTQRHWGCRVSRVPIHATWYAAGTEFANQDEPLEEPLIVINWGEVGTGFMSPTYAHPAADADQFEACQEAEQVARDRLLKRGDCFCTRKEAEDAAVTMLRERAAQ